MKATMFFDHLKIQLEVEGEKWTEIYKGVAEAREIFSESQCGVCKCNEVKPAYRKNKDEEDFFELQCTNMACRAYLSFGQNKKGGGMFPHRKLIEEGDEMGKPSSELGKYGKTRGWTRYRGKPIGPAALDHTIKIPGQNGPATTNQPKPGV